MAIGASLGVIFSKNPVRSVLCLVWTFVATAAVWLLAQAEFLAIALVLVYVGAVMVLFLFVVMMLDVEDLPKTSWLKVLPLSLLGAGGLLYLLLQWIWSANADMLLLPFVSSSVSNVMQIGQLLFTDYILAFEVAGVLLLVAIVAAISLTFRGIHGNQKRLDPSKQVLVSKNQRLKILPMSPEERR